MSSGSSGHNVTAPEPLCSILFLMQRIPVVILHGYRPRVWEVKCDEGGLDVVIAMSSYVA